MDKVRVYRYRWIVLSVFMLATAMIEAHWVNFAPITNEAAQYYGVTQLQIGLFSLCYMFVFLVLCIPASYAVEKLGLRTGVGIGVVLTAIFGVMKGVFSSHFYIVLAAQVGLAVAQPFILNSGTMLAAKWFPVHERATATGLATLAQYLGIIACMVLTPIAYAKYSMHGTLVIYGAVSVAGAVLFLLLMRENPPTPPAVVTEQQPFNFMQSMKAMMSSKDMILLIIIFFFGIGMFNAVTTWIEPILSNRGLNGEQAGIVGAAMMVGGVVGAVLFPVLSDLLRKRKAFILITMLGTIPGLAGVTFFPTFSLILGSAFVFGFFIMAAGPIGFQYAAEISFPVPEASSQGVILLSGQISGILFVYGMDFFKSGSGSMTPFMCAFIVFMAVCVGMALLLKESTMVSSAGKAEK